MVDEQQGFQISTTTTQEMAVVATPRLLYQIDKPDWDMAVGNLRDAKTIQATWGYKYIQYFTSASFAFAINSLVKLFDAIVAKDTIVGEQNFGCLIISWGILFLCLHYQIRKQTDVQHYIKNSLTIFEAKTHRDNTPTP